MEVGLLSEFDGCGDSAEMTLFSFEVHIICVLIHFRIFWGQHILMVPRENLRGFVLMKAGKGMSSALRGQARPSRPRSTA